MIAAERMPGLDNDPVGGRLSAVDGGGFRLEIWPPRIVRLSERDIGSRHLSPRWADRQGYLPDIEYLFRLHAGGIEEVAVAMLEEGDLGEDAAANMIVALMPANVRLSAAATGRVNIYATERDVSLL